MSMKVLSFFKKKTKPGRVYQVPEENENFPRDSEGSLHFHGEEDDSYDHHQDKFLSHHLVNLKYRTKKIEKDQEIILKNQHVLFENQQIIIENQQEIMEGIQQIKTLIEEIKK